MRFRRTSYLNQVDSQILASVIGVDLTEILGGDAWRDLLQKSCGRGKNTFSYIVMQVMWCLKFCNMTKSGGHNPAASNSGDLSPVPPPVIYAHEYYYGIAELQFISGYCKGGLTPTSLDHCKRINFPADKNKFIEFPTRPASRPDPWTSMWQSKSKSSAAAKMPALCCVYMPLPISDNSYIWWHRNAIHKHKVQHIICSKADVLNFITVKYSLR